MATGNTVNWTLTAPSGSGDGPAFDLDTLADTPAEIKTIKAGGSFDGQVVLLVSDDGVNFVPVIEATFPLAGDGVVSLPLNARYWAVRREKGATSPASTCIVQIAAAPLDANGGGGAVGDPSYRQISDSAILTEDDYNVAIVNPSPDVAPLEIDLPPDQPAGKTFVLQDFSDANSSGIGRRVVKINPPPGESIYDLPYWLWGTRGTSLTLVKRDDTTTWEIRGWTTQRFPLKVVTAALGEYIQPDGSGGPLATAQYYPVGKADIGGFVRINRMQITSRANAAFPLQLELAYTDKNFLGPTSLANPVVATIAGGDSEGFSDASNFVLNGSYYLVVQATTAIAQRVDGYIEVLFAGSGG